MSDQTPIITAPKHYQGQDVRFMLPMGRRHPIQSMGFVYLDVVAKELGAKDVSMGSYQRKFQKERHYASCGAIYLGAYTNGQSSFEIVLPQSKTTVVVDKTTFDFIATLLASHKAMADLDSKNYLDYAEQEKKEQYFNVSFNLRNELFDYETVMTDEEKQYANQLKPIVDELLG